MKLNYILSVKWDLISPLLLQDAGWPSDFKDHLQTTDVQSHVLGDTTQSAMSRNSLNTLLISS